MTNSLLFDLQKQTQQGGAAAQGSSHPDPRQEVSHSDVSRFQQALQGAVPAPATALPAGPFALFGTAPSSAAVPPPAHEPMAALLSSMVSKLMVSDGYHSQRRIRIELAEDVMPGVSLQMHEEGGAMVVAFECSLEASFLQLSQPAQSLANQLAVTLERDTVWRVLPDPSANLSHLPAVEAFGQPH